MGQLSDDAPAPRLCNITKSSPTEEYGYNLHAEKKRGQFVGLVDKGSPADIGGLRTGDRIFAVNGHSIVGETHKQVVQRIKEHPTHCEMLVLDQEGCDYYGERNIPVTLSLPNIIRVEKKEKNGSFVAKGSTSLHQNPEPVFVAPPPPHDIHDNMDKPYPLLCELTKTSKGEEFGFNLHAERGRGHFIGDVDDGGIGDKAGLLPQLRIVGVNGTLIYPTTPHKKVIQLIKSSNLTTTLLLTTESTDKWYKNHNEEFSFEYAIKAGAAQQISPHSIQISDDEIHDNKLAQERARYDEPPVMEPTAPEEYPVPLERTAPVAHVVSEENGTEMISDDILNAIFSGIPGLESYDHVITSPELSREERAETQSSLVSHEGHSRTASVQSFDHISLGRESAVDVPSYDPYAYKPAEKQSDYFSPTTQSSTYNHHHSATPSIDDNEIFLLSAREARERLRPKKDKRGLNMTLDEKYRLVSNM